MAYLFPQTSLFEELVDNTIETCKDIPTQIALTGKIALTRTQINMQIGELFILRINIHLNGSVLDTPEVFWTEPHLEPVYQAVRQYLEMDQRVGLLTERLDVIADLLAVLKDQLSHGHGEKLEWIGKFVQSPVDVVMLQLLVVKPKTHSSTECDTDIFNSDRAYRGRDSCRGCKYRRGSVRWSGLGSSGYPNQIDTLRDVPASGRKDRCPFCIGEV